MVNIPERLEGVVKQYDGVALLRGAVGESANSQSGTPEYRRNKAYRMLPYESYQY